MAEGSGAQGQARLRPDLRLDFSVANTSQPASLLLKESDLRGHGHSERPGTHAKAPPRCLGGLSRGSPASRVRHPRSDRPTSAGSTPAVTSD